MSDSKHHGLVVLGPDGQAVSPVRDREAWKAVRGPRIGSSDTAAILGKDEYRGPWDVWDRIVLGDWDDADGADIRRGNRQEANARVCFTERTGLAAQELPMVAHPTDERIVTDLDGIVVRPDEWPDAIQESEVWSAVMALAGHGWLELKCPRVGTFYRYKEEGLPERYVIQGQHHGMVTGLAWGFFAFYTPEYDDLVAFPVITDAELAAFLLGHLGRWYDRHVDGRVRPERFAPPLPRWPRPVPGEAKLRADDEWMTQTELLALRHYELLEAQEAYEQTEAALVALLDDEDQHVAGGGVTVKRRSTASRTLTDWKAFRAAVKLAQEEEDVDALLALDPDDEAFKYQTQTSEKVEVTVRAPNPAEQMKEVA